MKTTSVSFLAGLLGILTCCAVMATARLQDEVSRRNVPLDGMTAPAKETYVRAIRSAQVGNINEVTYRGAVVMYEIEQRMERRRVELVIRYDGSQMPSGETRKPKVISRKQIAPDKLPQKVASAVAKNLAPEAVVEAREVSYRGMPVIYEVDSAEQCIGFLLDGQQAYKSALPATNPSGQEQAQGDGDR